MQRYNITQFPAIGKVLAMKYIKRISLCFLMIFPAFPSAAEVKVVTGILPLHSLASMITEGISEPEYLLSPGLSPHSYALKPSDVKKISEADVIFIIDKDFERFMSKALAGKEAKTFYLSKIPNIKLLPLRKPGDWSKTLPEQYDFHLWLDTDNAAAILQYMTETLAGKDPANAAAYRKNSAKALKKLQFAGQSLKKELKPYRQIPFLVFHDGWQYFEQENGLNAKGAVLIDEDIPLSIKQRLELENKITAEGIVCIFSEPQFSGKTVSLLAEKKQIRTETADPLGGKFSAGPDLYFQILTSVKEAMKKCLQDSLPEPQV